MANIQHNTDKGSAYQYCAFIGYFRTETELLVSQKYPAFFVRFQKQIQIVFLLHFHFTKIKHWRAK